MKLSYAELSILTNPTSGQICKVRNKIKNLKIFQPSLEAVILIIVRVASKIILHLEI